MQNHFDNDGDLVEGLLGGDAAAFEAYFHTCYPRLYRFALRRLARPALAEEVAQEAIVKGLAKLESFRGEASLLTWLCGICRNEIALVRRRHPEMEHLHPVVEDDPSARTVLELLAHEAPWPETLLRREQTIALVQSILDCLPSLYGDVLEWKYVDGLSVAEIAGRIGRSEKAIESMLTRARDAFRSALEELYSERAELIKG